MGYSTYSDICENVTWIGDPKWFKNIIGWENTSLVLAIQYQGTTYDYEDQSGWPKIDLHEEVEDGHATRIIETKSGAIWTMLDECVSVGKKGELYAGKYADVDGNIIYLVNTSQYEMVGECDYAVCGDNKACVQKFLDDIGAPSSTKIEDLDAVHITA